MVYGGACSLDGFLAREDGAVDWLMWSDEAGELMKESWSRFDAMIMGRKTWEVSARNFSEEELERAREASKGMRSVVFSRSIEPGERQGVEFVNSDVGEFVRGMKRESGKDICVMGGGLLARSLFEADLIDEVGFNVHPLLLGSGVPSFHPMTRQIDLELVDCKPLKNGCVYVLYSVKR